MTTWVIDMEANGLEPDKIHCVVAQNVVTNEFFKSTDYEEITDFLENRVKLCIGHYFSIYDIFWLEKLLKKRFDFKIYDTVSTSWYLYPERETHNLDDYGEELGIKKPEIEDWDNLSPEEYLHRCTEDVKINRAVWEKHKKLLRKIYKDEKDLRNFLDYLAFKMDCVREQQRSKWKCDVDYIQGSLIDMTREKERRKTTLESVMPPVKKYGVKAKPKVFLKADGSISSFGQKWLDLLKEHDLPEDYDGEVRYVLKEEAPNADSSHQRKEWLFSLGWIPTIFNYKKEDDGSIRSIPQIRDSKTGDMCEHIEELMEEHPELEELRGYSVLSHRIPMLQRMLKDQRGGYLTASVQGLTNTLRFIHAELVNLPKAEKPYGENIRGALVAREGNELCGADMSSLEDRLKHHFLYRHDPDYVIAMSTEGYDPHLALGMMAGMLSQKEVDFYKYYDNKENMKLADQEVVKEYKRIKSIRGIAKNGNYAL